MILNLWWNRTTDIYNAVAICRIYWILIIDAWPIHCAVCSCQDFGHGLFNRFRQQASPACSQKICPSISYLCPHACSKFDTHVYQIDNMWTPMSKKMTPMSKKRTPIIRSWCQPASIWFFVQSIGLLYVSMNIHELNFFCRPGFLCSPSSSCRRGPRCMIIVWPSIFDWFCVKHDHEFETLLHHETLSQKVWRPNSHRFAMASPSGLKTPSRQSEQQSMFSCFSEWQVNDFEFVMEQNHRYTQCCFYIDKYIFWFMPDSLYFIVQYMLVPGIWPTAIETCPTTGQSCWAKEWGLREPESQSHEEDEEVQRGEAECTWASPEKGRCWVPSACQSNLASDRPVEVVLGFVRREWHCWSESKVFGNGCLVIGHRRGLGSHSGQSDRRDWGNNPWG